MDLECAVCLDLLSEDPSADKSKDSCEAAPSPPTKKARRSSTRLSQQRAERTPSPPSQPSTSTATSSLDNAYLCVTKCGHAFHKCCVNDWFEKKETCPTCNTDITRKDLGPLYLPISSENKRCKQCLKSDVEVASLTKEVDDLKKSLEREKSTPKRKSEEDLAAFRALNKQVHELKAINGDAMAEIKLEQDRVKERNRMIDGLAVENEGLQLTTKKITERADKTQRKLEEKCREYCSLMKKFRALEKKYQKEKKEKERLERQQASEGRKLRSSSSSNSKSSSWAQSPSQNTIIIDSSSDDEYYN